MHGPVPASDAKELAPDSGVHGPGRLLQSWSALSAHTSLYSLQMLQLLMLKACGFFEGRNGDLLSIPRGAAGLERAILSWETWTPGPRNLEEY